MPVCLGKNRELLNQQDFTESGIPAGLLGPIRVFPDLRDGE
jgi:hypothetical protein